jgi:hypothetical protein
VIATGTDDTARLLAERIGGFIVDAANNAPRSLQKRIGPSEVGDPCKRKLAYKLLDWPEAQGDGDPIASVLGTGFHGWMQEKFEARNTELPGRPGVMRYRIEERVTVHRGYGEGDTITGSSDLYDRLSGTVYDWKLVGTSSQDNYRRKGPGQQYRKQGHMYGLGQENDGETPKRVAIVFVARYHELKVHVWSEPYDRQVALDAVARLNELRQQVIQADPQTNPGAWDLFPMSEDAKCRFCPWLKPGSTDLSQGCPGIASTNARPGSTLQALIA